MKPDCRNIQIPGHRARALMLVLMLASAALVMPCAAYSQPHEAAGAQHAGKEAAEKEAHQTPLQTAAKLANFAILIGVLVYFLKIPVTNYLSGRRTQVQQDLVTAAEMRATATAQLAEIDQKMQSLPAEIESLKIQGAQDLRAEQERIAQAAVAERERLLAQTRREIDMRLRVARRELTELAAQLAVSVAEQKITRSITPEDQMRLVDRYTKQMQAGGLSASPARTREDAR